MKIISVVGARPNFMKIAPFIRAINTYNANAPSPDRIEHTLVHTGQHYDDRMSQAFFNALDIPNADIDLGIGSGTHAEQVGYTMVAFENVLRTVKKPDWVVVVGDVNATLACSVTAKKEHVKCCHIEAGLRSGDMRMPEEINRLVTDRICDVLLTPDRLSAKNLEAEGAAPERIVFVGNIMIDTLEAQRAKAETLDVNDILERNALAAPAVSMPKDAAFAVMTLHRPSNVDEEKVLAQIIEFLTQEVAPEMRLIWPIHPRAKKQLEIFGLWDMVEQSRNLILLRPLGYHDMLRLNMTARIMLTDSGGLQEECTVLGTPCMTLRWNTERPVTLREYGGASVLVGNRVENIRAAYRDIMAQDRKPVRPELWDGKTAQRCLDAILCFGQKR